MLQKHAKIREGGRLIIPASYRKALNLHTGDELIMQLEEGEIRIFPQSQAIQRIRTAFRKNITKKISYTDDFIAFRKKDSE
jgi:AbrB family looped-hinge helix DNA binding protein